MYIYIFH